MPAWKLEIEYDGTRYRGWRMEHNQRTIQGELLFAARQLFASKAEIVGAEDTEAGVHARSNIAHLKVAELTEDITPRLILQGFNDILPHDINILTVRNADENFHARNDISARYYLYQISTRRTAFAKNFVWWNKETPNIAEMKKAAELVAGKKNFQSFSEFDDESKRNSPAIFVEKAEVFVDDFLVCIRIGARRFLPKMMQRLAGTLAEVGRGGLLVKDFERMLKFRSDAPSKFNAPPSGMFLEKIVYKDEKSS